MLIATAIEKMIDFYEGNIHDIACPLCREKYGNTNGKHQEEESTTLVEAFQCR